MAQWLSIQLYYQSGHKPRLQIRSPVVGVQVAAMDVSLIIDISISKIFLKNERIEKSTKSIEDSGRVAQDNEGSSMPCQSQIRE